jgi:hypothetical protein
MGQKELIVALILGLMVVGGSITTFVIMTSDSQPDADDGATNPNNGGSLDITDDTNQPPRISVWNVTWDWNGEKPLIHGVAFDEDLANVTVNMVVYDENMTPASLSTIIFQVNPADGTWSVEFPLSIPGHWIVKIAAMDALSQTSNLTSAHLITNPPTEELVEIMFLWTQPEENSSVGILSGLLTHNFLETCSVIYSPVGQTPLATLVNYSSGEYRFEIYVNTTNTSGHIIADCGLFIDFAPVAINVDLPLQVEPEDDDSDGIINDVDDCPDTPEGEPVYSDGCSDSQRDSDGDGIFDDVDQCPNTPSGQAVDAEGCADSQKDSDGDGISNALDLCPSTPVGESVDADGCSDSQKDGDGDGVGDDIDLCPDTPLGDTVGADGCTIPDWAPEDSWLCTDGQEQWVRDWNEQEYGSNKANNNGASSSGASDDNAGPWFQCQVSVTVVNGIMVVDSNGIPNHDFLSTLGCCADEMDYTAHITLNPVNDTTGGHTTTDCPASAGRWECAPDRGAVALAVDGVPMFGPEEGPGGDAVALHFSYFDEDRQPIEIGWCTGHSAGPNGYHYHYDAQCIHWEPEVGEDMSDYDISKLSSSEHSPIIGWAWDGYPVYGMYGYDDDGLTIRAITSSYAIERTQEGGDQGYNGIDDWNYVAGMGDLDECNGRWGPTPEYPDGIYHYVSSPMSGSPSLVTNTDGVNVAMIGFPYFLLCYHGVADIDGQDVGGGQGGGPGPPPQMMHASIGMYSLSPMEDGGTDIFNPLSFVNLLDFAILLIVVIGITVVSQRLPWELPRKPSTEPR